MADHGQCPNMIQWLTLLVFSSKLPKSGFCWTFSLHVNLVTTTKTSRRATFLRTFFICVYVLPYHTKDTLCCTLECALNVETLFETFWVKNMGCGL